MRNERFERFIPIIIRNECGNGNGYVNNPNDTGGETIYGICRKNFPTIKIWKSLDDILNKKQYKPSQEELDEIYDIYHDIYYVSSKVDNIIEEELALQVFDMSVNSGVIRAIKILQSIVGVTVDGICGKKTLNAVNSTHNLVEEYKNKRKEFYTNLSNNKPSNKIFLKGWLNRVENTYL